MTRPPTCEGCPLHDNKIAIGFMAPEGTGSSGVLVVAEALGANEARDSLPLRPNAPAGSVFAGIIRRIPGLDRSQLLLSNTIWCQPGVRNYLDGAAYEYGAIEHCQQYNKHLVATRRPRAIVTLGAIPTRTITGFGGYNQGIKLIRGFIIPANRPEYTVDGRSIPVIPTYHPSFLLRGSKTRSKGGDGNEFGGKVEKAEGGMALAGVVRRDIELALKIAREGAPPRRRYEVIKGDREVMDAFIREVELHPERPLAWDIETPRSIDMANDESEIDSIQANVTQIQFALDADRGFVFPGFFQEWVRGGSRRLLASPNRKYSWNGWKFDNKVVSGHHGIPILGEDIDLMSAWSWIQPDLPKGLQFATSFHAPDLGPWKHLALSEEWTYGACDVISLHLNAEQIFKVMDQRGLRTSYDRHVIMLRTEMVEAQHRGIPVDETKHRDFGNKIYKEIDEIQTRIRELVPEEVLGWGTKSKNGEGYVRTPAQVELALAARLDAVDRIVVNESVEGEDEDGNPNGEFNTVPVVYTRRGVEVFNKKSLELERVERWGQLKPFSPNSVPQKLAYIKFKREQEINARLAKGQDQATAERLAKYKIPVAKTGKSKQLKENTGTKELDKLFKATGDEVFRLLVDITKLKKIHGTYIKGWKIVDGGIHTTFGLADTGTGQLTSTNPNVQNIAKHGSAVRGLNLSNELRSTIIARPGKVLLEFDKKAFHAQTMAFEAKDKDYGRIAAIDVHSYNAAFRLKLPEAPQLLSWSDKDLGEWFAAKKKEKVIYTSEACVAYPNGMTFKEVRDFKTKKVGLGINFKQGAQAIFDQNPEGYKNKKEVQDLLDAFYKTFPRIKKFQNEIAQLAHKQTYLISRFGYIRRFHDVYKWDPNKWNEFSGSLGDWSPGDDLEAAVAFLVANDAFGMLKEEMLRMAGYRTNPFSPEWHDYIANKKQWPVRESEDYLTKYGFCNQIHDSLFFHCESGLKDEAIENILGIMREPSLVLSDPEMAPNGLFVDASVNIGQDWASMEEVKGV